MGTLETVKIQMEQLQLLYVELRNNTKSLIFNDTLGGNFIIYNYELASQAQLKSPQNVGSCSCWFSSVRPLSSCQTQHQEPNLAFSSTVFFFILWNTIAHEEKPVFDIHVKISNITVNTTAPVLHWQEKFLRTKVTYIKIQCIFIQPFQYWMLAYFLIWNLKK